MVTGPSGQPSASSRTAYGSSQIFAAVDTAPLVAGAFFAWPAARVAINRHRHNHIFFLNFINVPLIRRKKPLCSTTLATGSAFGGRPLPEVCLPAAILLDTRWSIHARFLSFSAPPWRDFAFSDSGDGGDDVRSRRSVWSILSRYASHYLYAPRRKRRRA